MISLEGRSNDSNIPVEIGEMRKIARSLNTKNFGNAAGIAALRYRCMTGDKGSLLHLCAKGKVKGLKQVSSRLAKIDFYINTVVRPYFDRGGEECLTAQDRKGRLFYDVFRDFPSEKRKNEVVNEYKSLVEELTREKEKKLLLKEKEKREKK
jgi:hypothetical protein